MNLLNHKKILFIIIGFIVLVLLIFIFSVASKKNSPVKPGEFFTPSPTPISNTNPSIPVNIPEGEEQVFPSAKNNKMGTIVVESNPTGADVIIDAPQAEAPSNYPVIPANKTPFKLSQIPEGSYIYSATKDGYDLSEGRIEVKPGQTTNVVIQLIPLETTN
jgi:hypothetical protein